MLTEGSEGPVQDAAVVDDVVEGVVEDEGREELNRAGVEIGEDVDASLEGRGGNSSIEGA